MKQAFIICVCLLLFSNSFAQGITLLFKGGGSGGWNDAVNWIQVNTPTGQTPIQRAPTELDDVVFSSSQSGLLSVVINFDSQLDHIINVGYPGTGLYRCHSMHVSNTDITLAPDFFDPLFIDVSTLNGGFVLIDSGSNFRSGQFRLHGGNEAVNDLEIDNSIFGRLFRVNDQSDISWDPTARARFVNSGLAGYRFECLSTGGTIYADNCVFTTTSFKLGANSTDTITNTQIHDDINTQGFNFHIGRNAQFVSSNVKVSSFKIMDFYTSGSILNGNVSCDNAGSYFNFGQEDPANPLPNIINGNLTIYEDYSVGIAGDVKISGNLEHYSVPQAIYPDTAHVFINGYDIFEIGGIRNYGNGLFVENCIQNYCHFNLEFYGSSNSNILWPIAFPIDTLIVNKTGCAKVAATNSMYVSGQAKINAGQLLLEPNAGIPYKFVCAGDLNIADGGGLFLRRDPSGTVANMAIAGNINDYNTSADSSCKGLSNPYNGNITLYSETLHPSIHEVKLPPTSSIGNLSLIAQPGEDFILGQNLTVNDLEFVTSGRMKLGDHNLNVNGNISNYGDYRYIVTNGTGYLQINNPGNISTVFPVGTASSYTPATITNHGAGDYFNVHVQPTVLSGGTSGSPYIAGVVDKTWNITKATAGPANADITLQWNAADELAGFTRTASYISHYTGGAWINNAESGASGSDPYSLTSLGVTSFSPFAVMSNAAIVPITLLDFTGKYQDKEIVLNWRTARELNARHFTLEKSSTPASFKAVSDIPATGVSQVARNYQYVDYQVSNPVNYYRLKLVDLNGNFSYSKTIPVSAPAGNDISIFPNLVKDQLSVRLPFNATGTRLRIIDGRGAMVKAVQVAAGATLVLIDVKVLSAGMYTIIGGDVKGRGGVQFVKQ